MTIQERKDYERTELSWAFQTIAGNLIKASIDVMRGQEGEAQKERLDNLLHDVEMRINSLKINNKWPLRKDWEYLVSLDKTESI